MSADSVTFTFAKRRLLRLVALLTALMALVNISSGLFPALLRRQHLLSILLSNQWQYGSRLTTIFVGFLLLLLVQQLLNRKKLAWWLTEGLLLLSIFTHLSKGLDFEEASLALFIFTLLLPLKKLFRAQSDPVSLRSIPQRALLSAIVLLFYAMAGFHFFRPSLSLSGQLQMSWQSLFLLDYPAQIHSRMATLFIDSLYLLGIAWYGYILLLLLSPVLIRHRPTTQELQQVKTLVERYGATALSCAAFFDDKYYFFSKKGSVIIYTLRNGVAIVLAEPLGEKTDWLHCLQEFLQFAEANAWLVCFYQIRPEFAPVFRKIGFKLLAIGEEGVLSLADFSLEGSRGKEFRYSLHKLEKQKYQATVVSAPIPKKLLESLQKVSQSWLQQKHLKEMTFSVGSFDFAYLKEKPIAVLKNPQGQAVAFVSLLLNPTQKEVGIDLMRFLPDLPNAAMDYLFTEILLWAKAAGYKRFDFSLSPLSGVGQEKNDPWLAKALHFIFQHVGIFYNFQGLHHFKEKFHPSWSARYLAYQKDIHLTKIGLALLQAHQGKTLFRAESTQSLR